ncbi:MAG: hypothetical protein IPO42_11075 [Chitinophagaceae bacterium]|nr:hypothetical protein [Chitinophagaceae bacterium]
MGLRYDARIACITGLAMMLLCAFPFTDRFKTNKAATFWNILLPVVFMVLVLVLAIDFYHFDYLHQRLNATVLNYTEDAGISFNMMWQSYPLMKISPGLILLLVLARLGFEEITCPLPPAIQLL